MRKKGILPTLLFATGAFAYLAFALSTSSVAGKSRRYARMSLETQLREQSQYLNDPLFLTALSHKLNARQRFAEALPFAERAVGLDPDYAPARDAWAGAMLGTGQATNAYGQLKEFLAAHPQSADAHFFVARFYVTQDKIVQAQKLLEETVALDPRYARAWAILAPLYIKQGNKKLALEALEKTLALEPDNGSAHLQLAVMLSVDRPDRARQEFERAITLSPSDRNGHEQYARFLLSNQDFAHAVAQAEQAVAIAPDALSANGLLGRCLMAANKPSEALPYLEKAIRLEPGDPESAQLLMETYNSLGNRERTRFWQARYVANARDTQTRRGLENTLRGHPENADAQKKMARLCARAGDVTNCLLHQAAAAKVQPDAPRALVAAARDLDSAGQGEQALTLVRRITQQTTKNVEATEALADILLHLGRIHEAAIYYEQLRDARAERKEVYKRAIAARSAQLAASADPAERLLRQASAQQDPHAAETLLHQALASEPDNTRCLRQLLRTQIALSQASDALTTAQRLSTISPEDGFAQTMFSILILQRVAVNALPDDLRQELDQRLHSAENDPSVLPTLFYARGLLSLKEGQTKEAAHDLAEAARLDPASVALYRKLAGNQQPAGQGTRMGQALNAPQNRSPERQ